MIPRMQTTTVICTDRIWLRRGSRRSCCALPHGSCPRATPGTRHEPCPPLTAPRCQSPQRLPRGPSEQPQSLTLVPPASAAEQDEMERERQRQCAPACAPGAPASRRRRWVAKGPQCRAQGARTLLGVGRAETSAASAGACSPLEKKDRRPDTRLVSPELSGSIASIASAHAHAARQLIRAPRLEGRSQLSCSTSIPSCRPGQSLAPPPPPRTCLRALEQSGRAFDRGERRSSFVPAKTILVGGWHSLSR